MEARTVCIKQSPNRTAYVVHAGNSLHYCDTLETARARARILANGGDVEEELIHAVELASWRPISEISNITEPGHYWVRHSEVDDPWVAKLTEWGDNSLRWVGLETDVFDQAKPQMCEEIGPRIPWPEE